MVQELSTEQIFSNMHEWVKNSGVETYIRNTAIKMLSDDPMMEGQGIGSSDIACEMVNLHREWMSAQEYEPELNLLVFLMEKCNHLR